ncbi:unnamed protein product [Rhizophagus irregularis]|nr:unnamed protein product [Rhizophagus irregularis]
MPDSLLIERLLQPIVFIESIDDNLEVSFSPTNIESEIDDIVEFSEAVGQASNEVSHIQTDFLNFEQDSDEETEINEYQTQVNFVNQNVSTSSPIISNISYLKEDGLDFNLLLKERERHDAYNSRSILRRFKTSSSQITTNQNAIQPNKASHILSYFVKNDYQEERKKVNNLF